MTNAAAGRTSVEKSGSVPAETTTEINFDGLPGPTHNYSGLAEGNLASERHKSLASNPRQAALQGLAKMKALADRGFAQAVLPPHERPDVAALRALGFSGDDGCQCRDGEPVRGHGRRPRALHAGQSRVALPPLTRGADDHARAACDL